MTDAVGFVYEKAGILQLMRNHGQAKCPVAGAGLVGCAPSAIRRGTLLCVWMCGGTAPRALLVPGPSIVCGGKGWFAVARRRGMACQH